MRPFAVQLMGALAMIENNVAEMATGEGKTLTASLAASVWAWHGRAAHVLTVGMRACAVQLMGALAMIEKSVAEMATGEGKTLTASRAASVWAWHGRPVHVLTVNDYLVERDAHEMGPVYKMLGLRVGAVIH